MWTEWTVAAASYEGLFRFFASSSTAVETTTTSLKQQEIIHVKESYFNEASKRK